MRWLRRIHKRLPYGGLFDRLHARFRFYEVHGRAPNSRPWFNDYLYNLKVGDALLDPLRVQLSDKDLSKSYIRDTVGEGYAVPTLAVLRSVEQIRSYDFPASCAIKPTHSSKRVILRRDGEEIDLDLIESWLDHNYYFDGREKNYIPLEPKVIVEPLLFQDGGMIELGFYAFDGEVKAILLRDVVVDGVPCRKLYDAGWNDLGYSIRKPRSERDFDPPACLPQMLDVARRLAAPIKGLIRIDIFMDGQEFLVGELTNLSGNVSGFLKPREAEADFSRLLFGDLDPRTRTP